jgi:pSer/pThr/pTyr-binding forkhead associated (FHA) protein
VSYSHQDKNRVYPEILRLYNLGYRIWYDKGIEPGSEFPDEVAKAIKSSSLFMVFISHEAVQSDNVENEINFALENKIKILPIYLEETKLTGGLQLQIGRRQGIMKFRMTEEAYNGEISKTLPKETLHNNKSGEAAEVEKKDERAVTGDSIKPLVFLGENQDEKKYQVYLNFRDIDEAGDPTYDSILARKVFKFLSRKGLSVFPNGIANEQLGENVPGIDKEKIVEVSKVMVVVGESPDSINSRKVSREWNRFSELISVDSKPDGLLISYIKGFERSKLPKILKRNEVIQDGIDSLEDLYRLIANKLGIEERSPKEESEWREIIKKGQILWLCRCDGVKTINVDISQGNILTVGRLSDNDIVLDPYQISRRHAEIIYNKEGLFVKDLNSANGTFVNKIKVAWKELISGDEVRFDTIPFKVCLSSNFEGKM